MTAYLDCFDIVFRVPGRVHIPDLTINIKTVPSALAARWGGRAHRELDGDATHRSLLDPRTTYQRKEGGVSGGAGGA